MSYMYRKVRNKKTNQIGELNGSSWGYSVHCEEPDPHDPNQTALFKTIGEPLAEVLKDWELLPETKEEEFERATKTLLGVVNSNLNIKLSKGQFKTIAEELDLDIVALSNYKGSYYEITNKITEMTGEIKIYINSHTKE